MVTEVSMGLIHKKTILLSEESHRQLTQLAHERGKSIGELVRRAFERQYGTADRRARLAAAKAQETMRLPVGSVEQMIAESLPDSQDLPG
jgi:hypothetical protein